MNTNRIFAFLFIILSFIAVIMDSAMDIPAGLAAVAYAILSLKE